MQFLMLWVGAGWVGGVGPAGDPGGRVGHGLGTRRSISSGAPPAYLISFSRIQLDAEEPPADHNGVDMQFLMLWVGAGWAGESPPAYLISFSRIKLDAEEPPADHNGADMQFLMLWVGAGWVGEWGTRVGAGHSLGTRRSIFSGPPPAYLISCSRIKLDAEELPADHNGVDMQFLMLWVGAGWAGELGTRWPGGGTAWAPGESYSADRPAYLISCSRIKLDAEEPPADHNGVDMQFLMLWVGAGWVGGVGSGRGPGWAGGHLGTRRIIFSGPPPAYLVKCSRIQLDAEEPPADHNGVDMQFLMLWVGAGWVGESPPAYLISFSRIQLDAEEPPADHNGADMQFLMLWVGAGWVGECGDGVAGAGIAWARRSIFSGPPPAYLISCSRIKLMQKSRPRTIMVSICNFDALGWRRLGGWVGSGGDPGGRAGHSLGTRQAYSAERRPHI
eukprot:gene12839-8733_t